MQTLNKFVVVAALLLFCSLPMQSNAQALNAANYEWKNAVIGGGGFVTGVTFSEAQQHLIYARTDVGGAYRWDSSSQTWIQLMNWMGAGQDSLGNVESIAADPADAQRVYIVGGESDITRVMRSTDQGRTFTLITPPFRVSGNGPGRSKGERLVIDPNSTNILFYASRSQGLFKSTDYGSTWSSVSGFPVTTTADGTGINFIIFQRTSATPGNATNVIYAGVSRMGNSLYRSTNGGNSWQLVSGAPTTLQPIEAGLDGNAVLYISYSDAAGPNGISTGAVWKYHTVSGQWTNINPPAGQGGFGGLAVDKNRPGTLMVATVNRWWPQDDVYRSTDSGASWRRIDDNAARDVADAPYVGVGGARPGNWIFNLRIDPFNSNRAMHVTGAGIWSSENVTNNDSNQRTDWKFLVRGIEESGAYDLISPPSSAPLLSVLGDIGGFRHDSLTVAPASFFQPPGWGTGTGIDFAQNNPNIVVRSYWGGANGAYSGDNGRTWTAFASSPSSAGNHGDKIAISPNGGNIVWAVENDVPYRSTDNGASWTRSTGIPNWFYSLKSDRVNSNKFYAYHNPSGYMYVSTNGGASYAQAGFVQSGGWYRMATNPWVEGDLWVPMWDGLYRSTNSGQTFSKLSNVQEAVSVTLGKAAPGNSYPTVFIQARINNQWGYFASVDAGGTWNRINTDQHQYGYPGGSFLVADQSTYGRVYFSTHCMGVAYGQLIGGGGNGLAPGRYRIVARHSGKALDVNGGSTADGANVQQWTYSAAPHQQWDVTSAGSGIYRISVVNSGKALETASASTANGVNVDIRAYTGASNQHWTITATSGGYYRVSPVSSSSSALDVAGNSTADGANVLQWNWSGSNNQQWMFQAP